MSRSIRNSASEEALAVLPHAKSNEDARIKQALGSSLHAALLQAVEYARRLARAELAAGYISGLSNSALSTVAIGSDFNEVGGWLQAEQLLQRWFDSREPLNDPQPGRRDKPADVTRNSTCNRRCTVVSHVEDAPPPFATRSSKILLHGDSGLPGHLTILLGWSDPAPSFRQGETALLTKMWEDITQAIELAYLRSESLRIKAANAQPSRHPAGGMTRSQLLARLSRMEREVLAQLLRRKTEPQVAHQLGRSPHTVHVHVKNIYRKLSVTSRSNLLQLFEVAPFSCYRSELP